MKRVLLTGMSGTGKSRVILELAERGYKAVDTDSDTWCVWATAADGPDWVWREDRMRHLLATEDADVLFVSGCKSNQGKFYPQFDHVILLSAPISVMKARIADRMDNDYGKRPEELAEILGYRETVEPLLRRGATLEVDTDAPIEEVVAAVLDHVVAGKSTMPLLESAAQDGEDVAVWANDQEWRSSWHPPLAPPDGTPHGASGVCVTGDGKIVLISHDGKLWGLPGGRPEGTETWEECLRREMHEEACATVVTAKLLGFSRSVCVAGSQKDLVLVRSFWRAEVELAPWQPQFEIPYRQIFAVADVWDTLATSHTDGSAPILIRVFHEATNT